MAVDKKSFVLYSDLIHTVSKMPNDKAGELFKHILSYVNDEEPKTDDLIIQLTFEPIRQQLKRDLKKYEDKRTQWSEAGKRSAEVRKAKKNQRTLTDVKNVATDLTVNVNDSVNVSVNDNVNEIKRDSALDFISETSLFETFAMQNKSRVQDWQMMLDAFNDKMDLELAQNKIEFEQNQIMSRLRIYCRSWIANQKQINGQVKKGIIYNAQNF